MGIILPRSTCDVIKKMNKTNFLVAADARDIDFDDHGDAGA